MKKGIFLSLFICFTFLMSINGKANKEKYHDLTYQNLSHEGYSTVIDTVYLSDDSYYLLSVSKEYYSEAIKVNFEDEDIEFFTRSKSISYYLTKYTSDNQLEFQKVIDGCDGEACLEKELYQKYFGSRNIYNRIVALPSDETQLILSTNQNGLYVYDVDKETLSKMDMEGLSLEIYDLVPADQGFVVVGEGSNYYQTSIRSSATIAKFSSDLKLEWVNFIDLTNSNFNTVAVVGHYIFVTGNYFKASTPGEIYGGGRVGSFIAKYDIFGNLYWQKGLDQTTYRIKASSDGNLFLVGKSQKKFGISTDDRPMSVASIKKVKVTTGEVIWENYFSTNGYVENIFTDLIETDKNEIIAIGKIVGYSGETSSNDIAEQFYHMDDLMHYGMATGIVIKFNEKGKPVEKTLWKNLIMFQMDTLKDGSVLLTGYRYPNEFLENIKNHVLRYDEYMYYPEIYGVTAIVDIDELDSTPIKFSLNVGNYTNVVILFSSVIVTFTLVFIIYKRKRQSNQ